jgi:hypothetical protein
MHECKLPLNKYTNGTTTFLKRDIDNQNSHNLSTCIANRIERDIQESDIAMIKMKHFSQKKSLA